MNQWIKDTADLFSFIGFIITILTFLGVFFNYRVIARLNKKNFKLNRMPENLESLKTISQQITLLIVDFSQNKKNIKIELTKILPILKSLKKSLNNSENEYVVSLGKNLKDIDHWIITDEQISWYKNIFSKKKLLTENMVDEIDIQLTRLITDIDNIGKDTLKDLH